MTAFGYIVTSGRGAVCGFFESEGEAEHSCRVACREAGADVTFAEVLPAVDVLAVMMAYPDGHLPFNWSHLNRQRRARLAAVLGGRDVG